MGNDTFMPMRNLLILAGLLCLPLAVPAQDYEEGKQAFLDQDYRRALEILQPLAESGHSQAQVTLGIMHDNGHGVPVDAETAFKWYKLAAEQGIPIVQHQVAFKYLHGVGVKQNYAEAAKWWELSANAGLADSQFNLALMKYRGLGITQDLDSALKLFTAASEQGHGHAQYSLAVMYAFGQGVEKNYEQALKWFHKSALQDVAQAQYNLGVFYENGFGIKSNMNTARRWYGKAAAQGLKQASEKLAKLEQTGNEIEAERNLKEQVMVETVQHPDKPAMPVSDQAIKREDWVMQQPADSYTLQIGSSVDEQGIVDFLRENHLTGQAAYIEVVVDDVTRYSALYGTYSSFSAANQAVTELPGRLQKAEPWVRNFGILQGMISEGTR
ncbi:MAG: SPOR domain-containing protein [Thiotrichales bacterium]|nr:SPOR domain-containing protein [Thiotrichales bacterium]